MSSICMQSMTFDLNVKHVLMKYASLLRLSLLLSLLLLMRSVCATSKRTSFVSKSSKQYNTRLERWEMLRVTRKNRQPKAHRLQRFFLRLFFRINQIQTNRNVYGKYSFTFSLRVTKRRAIMSHISPHQEN